METTSIKPSLDIVIRKHRSVLQEYGKMYGRRIFTIVRENVDLTYNKKKNEGQPSLIKPLLKFAPKAIDIYNIELIGEDGVGEPCILINNDPNLKFPVKNPDFKDVTPVTVKEALNSESPIFFADIEKLTKELNSLNMSEFRKASDLASDFTKQASFLSQLCQQNDIEMKDYKRQLEENDNTEDEVVIHQQVTVES